MNPDEQKIISQLQKLKGISLSTTEAQTMRENLSAYADLHAVTGVVASRKPSRFYNFSYLKLSHIKFSYARAIMAGVLILVLVGGSAGVTYAAEGSLPGQPLYAIKVSIAEPIQGALITSTAGKAQWQNDLAERRLAEAATLASQNNLATSTQVYLQNAVASHVALAQQDADTLAASGNETAALSVRADLEAKLSAHADILTLIAPRLAAAGDATTTDAVIALLQNIETDRTQVEISREATEATLIASSGAATSTPDDATTTSEVRATIALADSENSAQGAEELHLLKANSALFKIALPAISSAASTTASSTMASSTMASSTSSDTASTTASTHAAWITAQINKFDKMSSQNLVPLVPDDIQSTSVASSSIELPGAGL